MRSTYGLDVAADEDWRWRAACAGEDPDMWQLSSSRGRGGLTAANRKAKAICDTCPVARRCYVFALDTASIGIFGGVAFTAKLLQRLGRPT